MLNNEFSLASGQLQSEGGEQLTLASVPELAPGSEELAITKVIYNQLKEQNCLLPGERESVAYRMAEIMISAKNLYLEVLPRLTDSKKYAVDTEEASQSEGDAITTSTISCTCEEEASDLEEDQESEIAPIVDPPIFNELAGARMAFIHLRDLMADFDEAFMEAMASQREADGNKDKLEAPDFDYEYEE